MSDDAQDITQSELDARLFGPSPSDSPLTLPGTEGRAEFRRIFEQEGPESADRAAPDPISDQVRKEARIYARELLHLIRNTNITASLPAHSKPMLWSNPVDLSSTVVLPAAVSVDYTTVLTYKVPSGLYARFDGYGVDVDGSFTYDGSILWQITVNGLMVPTLGGWGEHRGTIAIPRKTFIVVPQDQTIAFGVRRAVAAGGTNSVVMALKGWTWKLRKNFEGTKASVTAF